MTKETTNFIKFFKDNITLILSGLYGFSFINYFIYYKSFEISIFNYISLLDLMFFSLESIFIIILLIFILEVLVYTGYVFLFDIYTFYILIIYKKEYLMYLLKSKPKKKRLKEIIYKKYFENEIVGFKILVALVMMFVISFFPYKLVSAPALLIYFIYILHKSDKVKSYNFTVTSISLIMVVFAIIATLSNSYNKRFEKDDYAISFFENTTFITTDTKTSTYNYLGETSSHIFLYDLKNKESKIYFKEKISDIKIKNTNNIDMYFLIIRNNYFVKSFYDMIHEGDADKKERREK